MLYPEGGGMNHRFDVGEIAIYCHPDSQWCGREVTIAGPLELTAYNNLRTGELVVEFAHRIDAPFIRQELPPGAGFVTAPRWLRKRRPPQDWVKLCELDKIPAEGVRA
jgi:hypothetical protein